MKEAIWRRGQGTDMLFFSSIESSYIFALEDDSPVDVEICNQGEGVLVDKTFPVE